MKLLRYFLLVGLLTGSVLGTPLPVTAQCNEMSSNTQITAFQQIVASSDAAFSLTLPTTMSVISSATVYASSNDARWRADGTAPTDSIGHVLLQDTSITLCGGSDISNIQFINDTGGSNVTLEIHYFGF